MPQDLLYEIGVEEIPAGFVLPALKQLDAAIREGLTRLRLEFGDVSTYGTPRRLAIVVEGVADKQPDIVQEHRGPPADRAYDAQGNPTKAAEGFARSRGVDVSQLEVMETDKGNWVLARVPEPGRPASAVLPGLLEEVTLALSFPKTMRWADGDIRFARPIRWIVALLGATVLELSIGGVTAGNTTRGHRIYGDGQVTLSGARDYVRALRDNFVLADVQERQEAIRRAAEAAATEVGAKARISDDLLTEVSFLVEWPTCLWGRFDPRFLQLPEPVIVTVMEKHQRYFPVEGPDGRLLPYFIAVRNGTAEGMEVVRAGNEKVIAPRLADAEFYLKEDLKHSLDDRVASLARVTFMEGLGTLADKTRRLVELVRYLVNAAPAYSEQAGTTAERAALLCKTDLVTLMVGDSKLGELQGVIGGEYARRLGEDEAVATAIAEHYRPRGSGDALPGSPAGTLLSIADKIDNLAAAFRLGNEPTGSSDPYALRRQAQGVVEMVLANSLRLDLRALLELAVGLLPTPATQDAPAKSKLVAPQAAVESLMAFFGQRMDGALTRAGVSYDVARAVLATAWCDLVEVFERGQFLQQLRVGDPDLFDTLVTAGERPARISRGESLPDTASTRPEAFVEEAESRLWEAGRLAAEEVASALAGPHADYAAAVNALAGLGQPIHEFFARVMVMVPDEDLRTNRLLMLRELDRTFLRLADFLQIVREGGT